MVSGASGPAKGFCLAGLGCPGKVLKALGAEGFTSDLGCASYRVSKIRKRYSRQGSMRPTLTEYC